MVALDYCDVVGSTGFEDLPIPFFLKVSEWAKSYWDILGFLFAKLHFNFVSLDSYENARTRPKLLAKQFF